MCATGVVRRISANIGYGSGKSNIHRGSKAAATSSIRARVPPLGPARQPSVEGVPEPEEECPPCATARAGEVRDAQSDAVQNLGGVLQQTERPAAERARRRGRDDVDLRRRLDR